MAMVRRGRGRLVCRSARVKLPVQMGTIDGTQIVTSSPSPRHLSQRGRTGTENDDACVRETEGRGCHGAVSVSANVIVGPRGSSVCSSNGWATTAPSERKADGQARLKGVGCDRASSPVLSVRLSCGAFRDVT